jgi:hypothetical protein
MMMVLIALGLAVFAGLASSAGYKTFAKLVALAAFLTFVGWLASGPGWEALKWIDNPTGPGLPSVDINP